LAGVLPALVLRGRNMRAADALILAGVTVMAATGARFLLLMPIPAAIVCLAFDGSLDRTAVGRRFGPRLRHMAQPPRREALAKLNLAMVVVAVLAGIGIAASRVHPDAQREAVAEHMPVAAVAWLLDHPTGERPFNTYSWGGYLGFTRPALPVYIDGRSDIYGDGPIREYARVVILETDPAMVLDRDGIDHVLFNTGSRLASWLDDSPNWERAYSDEQATIWTRAGGS
jgi:hypothetical protein